MWRRYSGDSVDIQWTPTGQIALEHHVDAWNGPKRFGLSQQAPATGIWLVDAKAGAKPVWLVAGCEPSFCPGGAAMAFSTDDFRGDTWILDMKTHAKRLLFRNATELTWSPNGREIAFVKETQPDLFSQPVEIRTYPELRLVGTIPAAVSPCDLIFSPDGATLGVHHHMSRPLTGHTLYTVRGAAGPDLDTPDIYAPPIIDDWSPDGKWLTCAWRIQDPENDGTWTKEFVALNPSTKGKSRRLGLGCNARFSSDSRHILYTTDHKTGKWWQVGDLMWQPIDGGKPKQIATGVTQFALFRF